jgi:hypothetical protein
MAATPTRRTPPVTTLVSRRLSIAAYPEPPGAESDAGEDELPGEVLPQRHRHDDGGEFRRQGVLGATRLEGTGPRDMPPVSRRLVLQAIGQ